MNAVVLQPAVAPDHPAAPAGGPAPGGNPGMGSSGPGFMTWLPFVMFIPLFFMMFRRQKKESEARAKLKKGDTIVTNAGIVGELTEVGEKFAKVKVAQGVTITVLTNVIAPLQEDPVAASKPAAAVGATAGDKK